MLTTIAGCWQLIDFEGVMFWYGICLGWDVDDGGAFVKTLMFGLVIAIVYLATYFVSTMERVW